jgi:hypothetical protein
MCHLLVVQCRIVTNKCQDLNQMSAMEEVPEPSHLPSVLSHAQLASCGMPSQAHPLCETVRQQSEVLIEVEEHNGPQGPP